MSNILLWGTVLIFALSTFGYTYSLSGVNRAFYGCFKAIAETSVIAYDKTGVSSSPYFSKSLFEEKCEEYFALALKPYTSVYFLSFHFCDKDTKKESEYPTQAEVCLSCKVYTKKHYMRSASFFIEEGKHGGK